MTESHIVHPLEPVFSSTSRILILGTMPSPKSREYGFYYMHPQNRFWKVLPAVFNEQFKYSNTDGLYAIKERKDFLFRHKIALWDVLHSCDIKGAGDSTIKNPVPNDFSLILNVAHISKFFCTGATAYKFYTKLCSTKTGIAAIYLPSTSPANQGRWPTEKLIEEYRKLLDF